MTGHTLGQFDDRVMSRAIAVQMRKQLRPKVAIESVGRATVMGMKAPVQW